MINQITNSQKNIYLISSAIIISGIIIAGAIIFVGEGKSVRVAGTLSPANLDSQPATGSEGKTQLKTITEEGYILGNPDAPVTIVEYSDFQCPFCKRFHLTVQQILEDYPDQVRWIYKHFPLDSMHSEARPSAEASECAAEQEKFWEFADELFENQSRLGSSLYKELASNIGLNMDQFENCVSSRKYKDKVEADYQEGIKTGVTGTPGSFINGERISGAVPYDRLKAAVEQALIDLE